MVMSLVDPIILPTLMVELSGLYGGSGKCYSLDSSPWKIKQLAFEAKAPPLAAAASSQNLPRPGFSLLGKKVASK